MLDGSDACLAPVLSFTEAPHHPHNLERQTYTTSGNMEQPALFME